MVPAERTVTVAIGHGKQAARNIDGWLRGRHYEHPPRGQLADLRHAQHRGTTPTRPRPSARSSTSSAASPTSTRSSSGLDESNALYEARRCLSCGNCFACDNCYGVCPDNAVIKLGPGGS